MNDLFRGKNAVSQSLEFTRPADTTAYAANDIVSNNATTTTPLAFDALLRDAGASGYLVSARLTTNLKSVTPRIRVHLYNAAPTVAADNAQAIDKYADVGKRVAHFDLGALATPGDTTNSDTSRAADHALRIPLVAGASDGTLYAVLETLDAFTPASGEKFTLTLTVDRY